ncbi:MAG TPA: folylpolyglutamate synthase/dihydrofolate synthase family protein [Thermaerobacter sp.]
MPGLDQREAIDYVRGLGRFGVRLGLERTRELLAALGHPERRLPPVYHIAGTNGKGSTACLIESILRAAGHRTALFTSPHLSRYEERFAFDGRPVAPEELAAAVERAREAVRGLAAAGKETPTEFEFTTAVFLDLVARRRPDAVILEVGLGGRHDATNAVPRPAVSVVTNVALDHTDRLGRTVAEIARDKAGIARPGVPLVTGAADPDALVVLEEVCAAAGTPLLRVVEGGGAGPDPRGAARYRVRELGPGGARWDFESDWACWRDLPLALRGRHQVANAAVALTALLAAAARGGPAVDEGAVRRGLATAYWPGRLERLDWQGREVWLDGAHNPAGMATLAQALRDLLPGRQVALVFGMLDDKDVEAAAAAIAPLTALAVVTEPASPRAARAERGAAALAGHGVPVVIEREPRRALERALAEAPPGLPLVVAGSLYLIGELRPWLLAPAPAPGV